MAHITLSQQRIELDADQVEKLFSDEFEGWCPVCRNNRVSEGEPICCDCFKRALAYHVNHCACYP